MIAIVIETAIETTIEPAGARVIICPTGEVITGDALMANDVLMADVTKTRSNTTRINLAFAWVIPAALVIPVEEGLS